MYEIEGRYEVVDDDKNMFFVDFLEALRVGRMHESG